MIGIFSFQFFNVNRCCCNVLFLWYLQCGAWLWWLFGAFEHGLLVLLCIQILDKRVAGTPEFY